MANYFNLEYESTAGSSPGSVELNYGNSTSNGLTVHVSLYAGSGFTPTHYKMWGVELVTGSGVVTVSGAEWMPFVETRDVRLARHNDPQKAYVIFKDSGETETETFESNAVSFTFVEPVIHGSVVWETDFEELGFETASSNVLVNPAYKTRVELNKNKLDQLQFSGRFFDGIRLEPETISVYSDSEIGQLVNLDDSSYVTLSKVFETSDTPMVRVSDGGSYTTLTTYYLQPKSTLSGIDLERVKNLSWNPGDKTLYFDAYHFSTYGFCVVDKVEFTDDSQTGAYIGETNTFRVYVQDSNGEPVESAPVTVNYTSGNIGSIAESMPVLTDSDGLAEFNLNVTSIGEAVLEANVDSTYYTDPDLTVFGVTTASGQRSLLTQYEQIYRTRIYDDAVADVNNTAVAEPTTPTVSGSSDSVLEHDLNVLRTLMKQLKGTDDWFSAPPKYFDPSDTDGGSTPNKDATLTNIAGNTLDSKTIITAVNDSNSGSGFSITPGDEGFLFTTALPYASDADRRGLPIASSVGGAYPDEGAVDNVVGIDLINMETGAEFRDASDNIIFAKFHDGADHSGTGDGTDVYIKFYTDAGPYTMTPSDPSSIMIVYPYRKVMSEVDEYEWTRTDFISSWEGDETIVQQIVDLWGYTGASNDESSPAWTSISGSPLVTNESSIKDGIEALNSGLDDRVYTEENYITSGQSISLSLDVLDTSMYALSQTVADGVGEKYTVVLVSDLAAGTPYQLPVGVSYTPDSTPGQQGFNMDVYIDGQLLAASSGEAGVNADRDYSETSPTHVTFHMDLYQYSNITFVVRK